MHSSQMYEVNKREQHKAAQRDQSYRNCLTALLIFFFLCLFLIFIIPWKMHDERNYHNGYSMHESQHHDGHSKETKPTTTETTKSATKTVATTKSKSSKGSTIERFYPIKTTEKQTPTERNTIEYKVTTAKEDDHMTTIREEFTYMHDKSQTERSENTNTRENVDLISTSKQVTNKITASTKEIISTETTQSIETATLIEEETTLDESKESESGVTLINTVGTSMSSTLSIDLAENRTERLIGPEESTESSGNFSDNDDQTEKTQSVVTISSYITSTPPVQSYSEGNEVTESFGKSEGYFSREESSTKYETTLTSNEHATRKSSSILESHTPHLNEEPQTTVEATNEIKRVTDIPISVSAQSNTERYNEITYNSVATESFTVSTESSANATTSVLTGATTVSYNDSIVTTVMTTLFSDEDMYICETGQCKQVASKLLSYMNHSADPCEDFYEYACGGFQSNPQLLDGARVQRSSNYQRIARQMLKEKHENIHSIFTTYYDSCVQYERTVNYRERIKMANYALKDVGKFYTDNTWLDRYVNFTELFAQLILHHSAFLFDVVPEFDEYHPNRFTLKIGPWMYASPFKTDVEDPSCSEEEFETSKQYVDLDVLYNNYKDCNQNTRELMRSIREALTTLEVFKSSDNIKGTKHHLAENMESEYIEKTINVINSVIMQGYFSDFPPKSKIREVYLTNDYEEMNLKRLQSDCKFINWAQLIHSLKIDETEIDAIIGENLQVYFHDALTKGLCRLEKFADEDPMSLNNAIMALYAHKLYSELVLPRRDNAKDYCLRTAANLLPLEASSLYVSSFSDREIKRMNKMTQNLFNELRRTLKLKTEAAEWAKNEGREELLKKIDSLELALPDVLYFKNRNSLYSGYNISQIILPDNYFNNSMILLRHYRVSMYAELREKVDDPRRIWTYYTTPFESKARVIYCWNLVVIPYGVIDWSSINDEGSFDYFLLATLGNIIAHQIAHHFDTNGIHYWNKTRNTQDTMLYEDNFTDMNFNDYINCHKDSLYQGPMNMKLPFTDQVVSFTIPRLSLNERLSDIVGLRLAYDTLAFTRSDAEKQLPWIKLRIEQLFYLAYAQMYCTKSPLTSSYVSLHESEDLPSRIRVFVSASNNKLVAEAWNCPIGSEIAPNDVCSIFPYIDFKTHMLAPK